MFVARDGETHIVVEAKLFLGLLEQRLKLWASEERNGHNISAPILSNVHHKVALWNVQRKALLVVAIVVVLLLSQA